MPPIDDSIPVSSTDITCANCSACCCRMPVLVIADPLVPEHYIVDDEASGLSFMAQGEDGWCVALDRNTMLCTIYELRPQICRDFAMGGHECLQAREDERPCYDQARD
ncbi:MAG: YkgJ family cysteine cluster protein [Aeromonadaceae bacterium]